MHVITISLEPARKLPYGHFWYISVDGKEIKASRRGKLEAQCRAEAEAFRRGWTKDQVTFDWKERPIAPP